MNLGDFFKEVPVNEYIGLDAEVVAEASEVSSDVQVLTYANPNDPKVVNNVYPYCVYDNAIANLIVHTWTELITLVAIEFAKAIVFKVFNQAIMHKSKWKPVLELSDFTLWLLYNQTVHWIIFIFCPFFCVIACI